MKIMVLSIAVFIASLTGFGVVGVPTVAAFDALKPVCDTAKGNVAGQPTVCAENKGGSTNPLLGGNGLFSVVIRIISYVAAVSAIAVIVVSGLKIIFSNGDSNTLATARKQIIFAVVGLAVIAVANAIIGLVLSRVVNA